MYHASLGEIFKKYYSRKYSKNMLSKTTDDVLLDAKLQSIEPALISTFAGILHCTDAVKFAKYVPGIAVSEKNHSMMKEAIERLENDRPLQKQ